MSSEAATYNWHPYAPPPTQDTITLAMEFLRTKQFDKHNTLHCAHDIISFGMGQLDKEQHPFGEKLVAGAAWSGDSDEAITALENFKMIVANPGKQFAFGAIPWFTIIMAIINALAGR